MRVFACIVCKQGVLVGGDIEEINSLVEGVDNFACFTPLCNGRMQPVSDNLVDLRQMFSIKEIPVRSFFRAIHGFGPGEGDPASLERLKELLLSKRIVDFNAFPTGQPERVIIREVILEDGTRLHFEASARGACIYYIEEPGPSCVEVAENVLDSEGSDQNREEGGRDPEALAGDVEGAEVAADSANHSADEQSGAGSLPGVPAPDHVRGSDCPGDGSQDTDPPVRM